MSKENTLNLSVLKAPTSKHNDLELEGVECMCQMELVLVNKKVLFKWKEIIYNLKIIYYSGINLEYIEMDEATQNKRLFEHSTACWERGYESNEDNKKYFEFLIYWNS